MGNTNDSREEVDAVAGRSIKQATDAELLELASQHLAKLYLSPSNYGDEGIQHRFSAVWLLLQSLQADIDDGLDIVPLIPRIVEQALVREREYDFYSLDKHLTKKIGPLGSLKRRDHSARRLKDLAPPLIEQGLSNRVIAQRLESSIGTRKRTLRDQLAELQRLGELPLQKKRQRD